MKRIVVVVDPTLKNRELFSGDLEIINKSDDEGNAPNTLVIKDNGRVLAVFNKWLYWRELF